MVDGGVVKGEVFAWDEVINAAHGRYVDAIGAER